MKHFKLAGAALLALAIATPALSADVEFMSWTYTEDGGKEQIEKMVSDYEADSGKDVEIIGYAWKDMNKNTFLRARTNTLPDVSQVQARFLPTLANIKGIVDLDTVFDRAELEKMFAPGFLAFGEVDGKQVALPWIGGTIGMVANRKVLEAAGVDGIPGTVEEFHAALEKIRDAVPNSVPYAMATKNPDSIVLDYLIWVWTHGGDVVVDGKPAVNSPEAVAALEFMVGLMKDRLAAPEIDRPDARRLFGQEASGFYFDAPSAKGFIGQFSGQGEAYAPNIAPMATPVLAEGDTPQSIQWGHVLVLYGDDNAKPDTAAADFVRHLLSDKELVEYAYAKGALPSTVSGQAAETIASDTYLSEWAAGAPAPKRNIIASLSNGSEVSGIIGEEVQAALLGQKSAQEAADAMQSRLEQAID
ncbi:extracellular solute-binding protein [Acuticoccus kandeliae]|uniref:extracellular solute-binding protein n=1 Tax=Acuticoccus kandeliae TaxID=2073160 RepID=UPI000D3E280B|nr:extracellular solute-binding protein [Acuticoccus kandeliae]